MHFYSISFFGGETNLECPKATLREYFFENILLCIALHTRITVLFYREPNTPTQYRTKTLISSSVFFYFYFFYADNQSFLCLINLVFNKHISQLMSTKTPLFARKNFAKVYNLPWAKRSLLFLKAEKTLQKKWLDCS